MGAPAEFLPFSRPSFGPEEEQALLETLRSGWITSGPRVERFESDFRAYVGARHALALTSATAGLHVALLAHGIGAGDEVVTTPLTWPATVNMIVQAGATPVFADVDPETLCLTPAAAEARITPRTKALLPVHFAGLPCDLDGFTDLARRKGLRLIEDAAHAAGTEHRGRRIGASPGCAVFSFHPIKNLTTGEGGMLCTDSDDVAARARLWRFHGVDRDAWKRYGSGTPGGYDLLLPGFKYNLTDLQAALGIEQLKKLDGFIRERTRLAGLYRELLSGLDGLTLPAEAPRGARHAWHLYTVRVTRPGLTRERFRERLAEERIGTGLHFPAAHLLTWCRERLGTREGQFPAAEAAGASLVSLPLFPGMRDEDVDDVAGAVRSALDAG